MPGAVYYDLQCLLSTVYPTGCNFINGFCNYYEVVNQVRAGASLGLVGIQSQRLTPGGGAYNVAPTLRLGNPPVSGTSKTYTSEVSWREVTQGINGNPPVYGGYKTRQTGNVVVAVP